MKFRNKILIPIVALILVLGGSFTYLATGKAGETLVAKQNAVGLALLRGLCQMAVGEGDTVSPTRFGDRLRDSKLLQDSELLYAVLCTTNPRNITVYGNAPRGSQEIIEWSEALDAPPRMRPSPDPDSPDVMELYGPIFDSTRANTGKALGTVRIGISYAAVYAERKQLLFTIATLSAFLIVGAILLASYLARSVTQPLEGLVSGIEAIGRGEMGYRIQVQSEDEIGQLAASFNQMADRLRISRTKIENYSRDLEEMVRARTSELRRAYDELKRLDELKDTFLSSVSHELRTPLTSIHSFVEILLQYADEDPATRTEFLNIIKRETERLSRLIDDVLDLAKIEAGMATWKVDRHDLKGIIEDALAAIRPLLDASKVSVHTTYPPRLPQILGDRDRLSQVITNLLSNARKFTHSSDTLECRLKIENGFIRVEVEDHGVGISPENKDKVFEKFRQIENEHLTDKPKGTGLGLPISRDIIEYHGGKMWCESELGKGATFIFTIPTADNPDPRPIQKHLEEQVGT